MSYNWQKGLTGGAANFLGGYSTVLQNQSKQELQERQNEAMLQREKSMAKYQQGLAQETYDTRTKDQRTYNEGILKEERAYNTKEKASDREYTEGLLGSGFMLGDREVTRAEYAKMSPEERAQLKSGGDHKIDTAIAIEEAKYKATEKLAQGTKDNKKRETLNFLQGQGYEGDDLLVWDQMMDVTGETDPFKLEVLAKGAASKLPDGVKTEILKQVGEELTTDPMLYDDKKSKSTLIRAMSQKAKKTLTYEEARDLYTNHKVLTGMAKRALSAKAAFGDNKSTKFKVPSLLDKPGAEESQPTPTPQPTKPSAGVETGMDDKSLWDLAVDVTKGDQEATRFYSGLGPQEKAKMDGFLSQIQGTQGKMQSSKLLDYNR